MYIFHLWGYFETYNALTYKRKETLKENGCKKLVRVVQNLWFCFTGCISMGVKLKFCNFEYIKHNKDVGKNCKNIACPL